VVPFYPVVPNSLIKIKYIKKNSYTKIMQGNLNDLDINLRCREKSLSYAEAAVCHPGLDFPLLQGYFKAVCFNSALYFKGKPRFILQSKKIPPQLRNWTLLFNRCS